MEKSSLAIVFNYQKTGKYALNVLAGSLLTRNTLREVPVYFSKTMKQLLADIENATRLHKKVIVAWSFYSPQYQKIHKDLTYLKKHCNQKNVIHLAGGVHATAEPLHTLNMGFDYVAIGEGEQIICDFTEAVASGESGNNVRGIAFVSNGQLIKNGKGKAIDLNDFPPCASRYRKYGPVEITRGCIYACKFCQTPHVNKARFRHRSIENVKHFVRIMSAHGLRDYRFLTPTSFSYGSKDESVNLEALELLLASVREIIGEQKRIFYGTFPSEIRPEHVSAKTLSVLKKYVNNDNVIIGGQSGSQNVLNTSRRGHDIAAIINAVKLSVKYGFRPNVDFLFGLPGETRKDAQQTIDLANKLANMGAKIHNHTFMPLPGTPFRNEAAGNIDEMVKQQIVELTTLGKAYGKWSGQLAIAKKLENLQQKK
jgi:B12-binding domain/radical SAM domain protein